MGRVSGYQYRRLRTKINRNSNKKELSNHVSRFLGYDNIYCYFMIPTRIICKWKLASSSLQSIHFLSLEWYQHQHHHQHHHHSVVCRQLQCMLVLIFYMYLSMGNGLSLADCVTLVMQPWRRWEPWIQMYFLFRKVTRHINDQQYLVAYRPSLNNDITSYASTTAHQFKIRQNTIQQQFSHQFMKNSPSSLAAAQTVYRHPW